MCESHRCSAVASSERMMREVAGRGYVERANVSPFTRPMSGFSRRKASLELAQVSIVVNNLPAPREATGMTTQTLYDSGVEFYERLTELKSTLNVPFAWYPYNTLANVEHLEKLLDGGASKLAELCKGGLILDMGCADGEWAFFLESLGLQVHALDCPITNHNGMAGVHALQEALGSKVEIFSADLDARFELPSREYALAFFFGTLYHLKNPYYVLEQLARTTRYCLLSTRIARNFHPRLGDVSDLPLAYLLGSDELNADRSNFWIFSPDGLRRLLKRTHWEIVSSYTVRKSEESNPWSLEGDERMFCLVESTYGFPKVELLGGWHAPEDSGWRWTERRFAAKLEVPKGSGIDAGAGDGDVCAGRGDCGARCADVVVHGGRRGGAGGKAA